MKNKLYFIIVATLLCPTSLYAQSGTDKRSVLSFQTGPTLYTGKLIGIAGYSSNLRNGIGWSGSYTYLVGNIIRKSKFPQNPKRSVRFSGKRTKRSVQKRKARNTQKAETKVL